MSVLLDIQAVSKRFHIRHNRASELKVKFLGMFHGHHREVLEEFWALRDVSLNVRSGEAVGVIGRNGSGKSTLLRLVAGLYSPTRGRVLVPADARIGTMIELGVGFHPELSGRENVYLNAAVNGLTRREIGALYPAIVEYSGLAPFMDAPLKSYSSGMQMRLGFSVAANLDPEILLLDEIFAVGDAEFQRQCLETLAALRAKDRTIMFVSHVPDAIRALCDRVCILEHGRLLFDGAVEEGLAFYADLTHAEPPVSA